MTIISKSCFRQNTCLTKLLIACSLTWWIQGLSRTCGMKFKDFQAPVLCSSTFKALNIGLKNSSTFKDVWEPLCVFSSATKLPTHICLMYVFLLKINRSMNYNVTRVKYLTSAYSIPPVSHNLCRIRLQSWMHWCLGCFPWNNSKPHHHCITSWHISQHHLENVTPLPNTRRTRTSL